VRRLGALPNRGKAPKESRSGIQEGRPGSNEQGSEKEMWKVNYGRYAGEKKLGKVKKKDLRPPEKSG